MTDRRFFLVVIVVAGLFLVSGLFSVLGAQAGESLPPKQPHNAGLAAGLPDLIVSRIDVLTMTSTTLYYRFVIQNIGEVTADLLGSPDILDNVDYQAYLSPDGDPNNPHNIGGGGAFLTEPAQLGPGEVYTYTKSVGHSGIYLFDYDYFFVIIDAVNNLVEEDENNNQAITALPDGPDLIVESVDVLGINNSSVTYQFVVRNIGDGIADLNGLDDVGMLDNVNYQAYLSKNSVFGDGDDIPAGGAIILTPTELPPGEVFTLTNTAGMFDPNYLDYRFIFMAIDLANRLPETDETNNLGMGQVPYFLYLPFVQQ